MSVDEVLILSTKDFNKRQEESQQERAGEIQKMEVWKLSKECSRTGLEKIQIIFLNKTGFVGFVFYNVIGESAEGR